MIEKDQDPLYEYRVCGVRITDAEIASILVRGGKFSLFLKAGQLPEDSIITGVNYDHQYRSFFLTIKSTHFNPVSPGNAMPIINLKFDMISND